jgi:hypothetical protein
VASAVDPAENPVKVYPVAALKAGPISFSITLTSDPAYSTSTGPDPLAAVEVGVVDAAADGAEVVGVVGVVVALELLLELPQADATRARAATTSNPTGRTLPPIIRGRRDIGALVIRRDSRRQELTRSKPNVISA